MDNPENFESCECSYCAVADKGCFKCEYYRLKEENEKLKAEIYDLNNKIKIISGNNFGWK